MKYKKKIDKEYFYRANRQFLINRNAIINAERFFARKLVIKLSIETPETITVSKVKSDRIFDLAGKQSQDILRLNGISVHCSKIPPCSYQAHGHLCHS